MIHRPLSYIGSAAFVAVGLVFAAAAVAAMIGGASAALVVFAVSLVVLALHQARQMRRMAEWARQPMDTPLPAAAGVWGNLYGEFSHRLQRERVAREHLADELARFKEAAQAMPDGVLYLTSDDSLEWLNHRAEQHFALSPARDVGAPLKHLVRQPEFVRYLEARHPGEPLVMHSGRSQGLCLQVHVIPFGNGRSMVLSRDISQIERLETMRRDFVANVSHELRTPLTVIGGFLETLIDGIDDFHPEEVSNFLRLAHEQSSRMQRLIDDLLALSALETGAPAPIEEHVDAAELVREVFDETGLLSAGRHQLRLQLEGGGEVRGSHKELHSAFANLASNAVRYTPAGGKIDIGWRLKPNGGEFWVEDNGIGIDADHVPRLTERFYRVDRGRSRETGGTGLGLAIVKHILTRHQGELRVRSEAGKGSRFELHLPAARVRPD